MTSTKAHGWTTEDGDVAVARATSPYEVAEIILDNEDFLLAVAEDTLPDDPTALDLLVAIGDRIDLYRVPTTIYATLALDEAAEVDDDYLTPWTWNRRPGSGYVLIAWVRA